MTAAEPVGDIHMPNASFSPFIISLGLFIAAFGALYAGWQNKFWLLVAIIGLNHYFWYNVTSFSN